MEALESAAGRWRALAGAAVAPFAPHARAKKYSGIAATPSKTTWAISSVSGCGQSATNEVDGENVPVRHFGVILELPVWESVTGKLRALSPSPMATCGEAKAAMLENERVSRR